MVDGAPLVLVSGSLAYDRIMDFPGLFKDHFLADKLHNISVSFQVETVAENFGGCAGNIAYGLALLGITPRIVATAGSDFARYKAHLAERGIDAGLVRIEPSKLTSAAFVMTDTADNQIAAFSMGAGGVPYAPLPSATGSAAAIISPGCASDMRALPQLYRSARVPYMYDPGQALPALSGEDLRDGITGAAVVFANDYEFGLIAEKTGWGEQDIAWRAGALVITYGAQGSRVLAAGGEERIAAAMVAEAVDPTGAGDAYRAGYIAAFVRGAPPAFCAKLGSALAAYAVEAYGTQSHTFTREELARRYAKAYGEDAPL